MIKANKIEKKLTTTVAIAAFCTMASGAYAQQTAPVTGTSQTDQSQYQQNQVQHVQTTPSNMNPDQPQRLNKCSGFIGTAVENPQGDRLGKIDDVVIDLNAGRVSYAVLSVEHKLFANPKYIALPLASLKPSADGTKLILNADKDKIAQAQGFDRNNWPSINTPAWGAQTSGFGGRNINGNNNANMNSNTNTSVGVKVPGRASDDYQTNNQTKFPAGNR